MIEQLIYYKMEKEKESNKGASSLKSLFYSVACVSQFEKWGPFFLVRRCNSWGAGEAQVWEP